MQIFNGKVVASRRPHILNEWMWDNHFDMTEVTEPASPAAGTQRLFVHSTDHHIKIKNSSGTVTDMTPSGAVTSSSTTTFSNKTFSVDLNTLNHSTTNAAGDLLKGNGSSFQRLARGTANQVLTVNAGGTDIAWAAPGGGGVGDMILASAQTNSGAKTFLDTTLLLRNSANTFSTTLGSGAQTAARTFTFPVTTSDTIDTIAATQTLTNKTINATNNTLTDTSTAAGDILKSNGTKFTRLARGTALQVLAVNSGGTDIAWSSLDSERVGKSTASGNGSTTVFNIAHGLGSNPTYAFAECSSITNTFTYTTDATNIVVTFSSAPASGTNNVVIYWQVIA